MDETYDAYHMAAQVCGAPTNPAKGDTCDFNGISEPDNVAFIPTQDSLLIGEDTNERQIDVMWQYNLATGMCFIAQLLGVLHHGVCLEHGGGVFSVSSVLCPATCACTTCVALQHVLLP